MLVLIMFLYLKVYTGDPKYDSALKYSQDAYYQGSAVKPIVDHVTEKASEKIGKVGATGLGMAYSYKIKHELRIHEKGLTVNYNTTTITGGVSYTFSF